MPFVKGQPRHPSAGRRQGSKNKHQAVFLDKAMEMGLDPITELVDLYQSLVDTKSRLTVLLKIMPYCYPTMRSIEIKDDQPDLPVVDRESLRELYEIARLAALGDAAKG